MTAAEREQALALVASELGISSVAVEAALGLVADTLTRKLAGEQSQPALVDAAEIARRFSVDRKWVYDHAAELCAIRLGDGEKPRLRFDPERVATVLSERAGGPRSDLPPPPSRQRRRSGRRDLLPGFAGGVAE